MPRQPRIGWGQEGTRRNGNKALGAALGTAAMGAARTKNSYLRERYYRLAARRGKQRAIVVIERSLLTAIWHMLGLRTLTDKGYAGAGIGIMVPFKGRDLAADNQTRNQLIAALRAPAERGNALLKQTWKALRHVTLAPRRITERGYPSRCPKRPEPVPVPHQLWCWRPLTLSSSGGALLGQ